MALELSDAELATAATACRVMGYQKGKRAQAMQYSTIRGPVEAASRRLPVASMQWRAPRRPVCAMPKQPLPHRPRREWFADGGLQGLQAVVHHASTIT